MLYTSQTLNWDAHRKERDDPTARIPNVSNKRNIFVEHRSDEKAIAELTWKSQRVDIFPVLCVLWSVFVGVPGVCCNIHMAILSQGLQCTVRVRLVAASKGPPTVRMDGN